MKTCGHLERYLEMTGASPVIEPPTHYTDDIDRFQSGPAEYVDPVAGVYRLFRHLRAYGIRNDEILLIIDVHVLGKSVRMAAKERHWTSYETAFKHYKKAMAFLKKKGFGGEK